MILVSHRSHESHRSIHRYRSYVAIRMANASETMRSSVRFLGRAKRKHCEICVKQQSLA